jgi:carboxyl-terminal processing protease
MDPSVHRVALLSQDPPVGHVRIERFQRETAVELDRALRSLAPVPCEALVIDLRDNPGGLYDEGVAVADRFLSAGAIVSTQGRDDVEKQVMQATGDHDYPCRRIAVLVNARTASAAEIVAAALREHGRAILVGEATYGKCSVQSVYQIFGKGAEYGALKLTTRRYFAPKGGSFSDGGLPVDQAVPVDQLVADRLYQAWQEDLRRSWDDPTKRQDELPGMADDKVLAEALAVVKDPARYRALLHPKTASDDGQTE